MGDNFAADLKRTPREAGCRFEPPRRRHSAWSFAPIERSRAQVVTIFVGSSLILVSDYLPTLRKNYGQMSIGGQKFRTRMLRTVRRKLGHDAYTHGPVMTGEHAYREAAFDGFLLPSLSEHPPSQQGSCMGFIHPYTPDVTFDGGDLDWCTGLLERISTETSVKEDLPAWCRLTAKELVSQGSEGALSQRAALNPKPRTVIAVSAAVMPVLMSDRRPATALAARVSMVQRNDLVLSEVVFTGAKNDCSFRCGGAPSDTEQEPRYARGLVNAVVGESPFERVGLSST